MRLLEHARVALYLGLIRLSVAAGCRFILLIICFDVLQLHSRASYTD